MEATIEVVEPTCETAGYSVVTCADCGYQYKFDEVPALGHDEFTDKAVAATCTETGLTEGKRCARCGKVLVEQTVVAALGHDEVVLEATDPTIFGEGLTEGKKCARCGATLVEQETVAALGIFAAWWFWLIIILLIVAIIVIVAVVVSKKKKEAKTA